MFYVIVTRFSRECHMISFDDERMLRRFLREQCVHFGEWDVTMEEVERAIVDRALEESDSSQSDSDGDIGTDGEMAALVRRVVGFDHLHDWRRMDLEMLIELAIEAGDAVHCSDGGDRIGAVIRGDLLGTSSHITRVRSHCRNFR